MGELYKAKLEAAGIKDTAALLAKAAKPAGRKALAEATGISPKLILKWVNMADLMRVKGVGEEFAELLEKGGVDTVKELARRVPANLFAKLTEVNKAKKLARRAPNEKEVAAWVAEAKGMPPTIEH